MHEEIEKLIWKFLHDNTHGNTISKIRKMYNARAVEPLIYALKDKNILVRRNAVWALGKIGDIRAVNPLLNALRDKEWSVRVSAAEALGMIETNQAVGPLKDKNILVRRNDVWASGEIGDTQAVKPLIKALKDEGWHVHTSAAEALDMISDSQLIELLISTLKDTDVRQSVVEILIKIGKQAVPPL